MHRWVGKIAVVTGASSGIGAAISKGLVKAGVSVVGLDKRLDELEKLSSCLKEAKGNLYCKKCDVRKEEDILNAFAWVKTKFGGVDILVNNAGLVGCGKITDDVTGSFRDILDVNVLAIAILIREAVASIKTRAVPGHVININSIAGHQKSCGGIPLSLYGPSKWAVTAMTDTIRQELAGNPDNKIKITSISPGLVRTQIFETGGWTDVIYGQAPYLDPTDISDAVLHVLGTRDKVQITELTVRHAAETL